MRDAHDLSRVLRLRVKQKKESDEKVMSALVQKHIDRIDLSIQELNSRLTALCEIRDTIGDDPAFSSDEQTTIQNAVFECETQLQEKRDARIKAVATLETTIAQCESELVHREDVLHKLFERDTLVDHQDLMEIFIAQHGVLKETLAHAIPDGD